MEIKSLEQEIEKLETARTLARNKVIEQKKLLNIQEQLFHRAKGAYDYAVKEYTTLDRDLALAKSRQSMNVAKPVKTYNLAKRTAEKAIKALESLPKELREKILTDMKDGLI